MQLFAFDTTLQQADYIKISNQSDQQCYQQNSTKLQILSKFQVYRTNSVVNRTAQSCKFCGHHISIKTLKIFCITS
ncbi:hypothetical protein O3M35_000920 [Rhynocoris fuscipes]|uniref:Uncharacterized protein n=1 Tax=Rhynocoris fuscipes TaxID=488301 RepID=A0AAW1DSX4_9HEMI